jgi:murein DD-endopeptidase MepM/ murein hydrolase activator NlpD
MPHLRKAVCLAIMLFVTQPSIAQTMTSAEAKAEAVWQMRAALNVAALQCQYDPVLKVVDNYNQFVTRHKSELETARTTVEDHYRRRYGKAWAGQFDRYNTRNYNGFSATRVQVAYCNKMGEVGSRTLTMEAGTLSLYAQTTVPEIRAIFPQPVPVIKKSTKVTIKQKTIRKKVSKKKKR